MIGHGGSSAGLYLADPTSPIPSHCASVVATSTLRVNDLQCLLTNARVLPCTLTKHNNTESSISFPSFPVVSLYINLQENARIFLILITVVWLSWHKWCRTIFGEYLTLTLICWVLWQEDGIGPAS